MDVERGRTVQKWLPARLGGGLGKTRSIGANKRVQRSYVYCFDYINHRLIEKKEREAYYEGFKNKQIQILFVNQASGAYGLDGLKEADYAVYLCNSYSVEQRQQSEDRVYRGEVKKNKYIIDLICKGTCEDKVTEALKQGKELLDMGVTDVELFKYFG